MEQIILNMMYGMGLTFPQVIEFSAHFAWGALIIVLSFVVWNHRGANIAFLIWFWNALLKEVYDIPVNPTPSDWLDFKLDLASKVAGAIVGIIIICFVDTRNKK